ncbi:NUDIX domain-containing protein [Lachnospiraceae bacterium LCP25S3_G4]
MGEEIKRIKRELKYKGAILELYCDYVQIPNGNIVKWDFIHHNGAAAVVPVMSDGKILMVRQYRNALDRYTLEIPAGKLNEVKELGRMCASRELEEETGYRSEKLEWLINIRTTVAFCNEKIEVFVARDLIPSQQNLDEDEFIDVYAYTMGELKEKIYSGQIEDSKTISALLAYDIKYNKE